MAAIRKRRGPKGQTVWQAQVIRKGFPGQYCTFDSKGAAEGWARRVESEMDAGKWRDRSEGDGTTLAAALERYLQEITPQKALTTQDGERRCARRLTADPLSKYSLSRVGGREVSDYIRARQHQGIGANTIRLELSLLSNVYTVARTAWGMPYLVNPVPLAKTARPKLPPGRERRLDGEEESELVAAASPAFAAIIRFALATAMRRGEIASLTWDQVDLERRCLTLGAAKNKNRTARTVPLSPAALDVLRDIPRRMDGSVFGLSPNAITLAWKRAIAKTGIEGLTFHDLRHEAISRLFEETDLDVMEIRAITGHKTLQMLARYTHLRTHRLADRLAGMSRISAGGQV